MKNIESPGPVVVGIDGSDAAIRAAEWAIDEAINRDVPLRLVHVMHIEEAPPSPADDFRLELEYAETALRAASAAVEAAGRPVKVDAAVLRGYVDTVLTDESLGAAMICVGSVGIGPVARVLLGSIAAALAERAHCPVAIIRTHGEAPRDSGSIVVVVDDQPDNDAVVEQAMEEARLRKAPVLALGVWRSGGENPYDHLDRRLASWAQRYPEVRVLPVAARMGAVQYLATHEETIQLAVIGSADADQVSRLVGPHSHPILAHADSSVLVVRK